VGLLDKVELGNSLLVSNNLGEGSNVKADIASPAAHHIHVAISNRELVSAEIGVVAEELLRDIRELGGKLGPLRSLELVSAWSKERAIRSVNLACEIVESIDKDIAARSTIGWGKVRTRRRVVSDPLKGGCSLVQQGLVLENERRHVALGVDLVEVIASGSDNVLANVDLVGDDGARGD